MVNKDAYSLWLGGREVGGASFPGLGSQAGTTRRGRRRRKESPGVMGIMSTWPWALAYWSRDSPNGTHGKSYLGVIDREVDKIA